MIFEEAVLPCDAFKVFDCMPVKGNRNFAQLKVSLITRGTANTMCECAPLAKLW